MIPLNHPQIGEVFTTEHTFAEVEEYALVLARKRHLPSDTLLLAVAALPVTLVNGRQYTKKMAESTRRMGRRDPDDIDLLALALHLEIPIWSNDRDFEGLNVDCYRTERLLRHLRIIE